MNLNEGVCSFKLAKKLQELKVKQDSSFYWEGISLTAPHHLLPLEGKTFKKGVHNIDFFSNIFSAFTVAELGKMLSSYEESPLPIYAKDSNDWFFYIDYINNKFKWLYVTTEADARAKMVIYLIENNLITIEEIRKNL